MRAMLLLNVPIHHDDGFDGPALACCGVTTKSSHTNAVAASSRSSKNKSKARSVSANALPHVWLMNHVAGATWRRVRASAVSSCAKLQRLRAVLGRMYIWHTCSVVARPIHAPNVVISHCKYSTSTPCSTKHVNARGSSAASGVRAPHLQREISAGSGCNISAMQS